MAFHEPVERLDLGVGINLLRAAPLFNWSATFRWQLTDQTMGDHGRAGGIRTHDLFVPNEARYQTALQPEWSA